MNDLYNMSILNGFSEIPVETKFGHLWKVPMYSDYFHKTAKKLNTKKFISQEITKGFSKSFFCSLSKIKENKHK